MKRACKMFYTTELASSTKLNTDEQNASSIRSIKINFVRMKSITISLFFVLGSFFASAQSTISYTFDKQGRLKTEIDQNRYEILLNYDKEGNIISKVINKKINLDKPILLDNNSEYVIYPNPTISDVTIEALANSSKLDIILCDISGKILEEKYDQESTTQFSLKKYEKGIYFFILMSDNKTIRYKIIKM